MKKAKFISIILVFCILIGGASVWLFAKEDIETSEWERRKLQQFPEITFERVMDGKFMKDFVSYMTDQFPLRNEFRRLKANVLFKVYQQKDNGGVYIQDGYASKIDAKINPESVDHFIGRMDNLYNSYIKDTDCKVYFSAIPDKNYFLAEKGGYPAMNYDELYRVLGDRLSYMTNIDIRDLLEISDYYTTDTHWKQECIVDVANHIREQIGMEAVNDYESKSAGDFYGVYYGQSALNLDPDEIIYLENEEIRSAEAYIYETDKTVPIYNLEKLEAMDHYDIFLSGAISLIKITNPMGDEGKKLVVFRDSFSSSLTPLLMSGYSEIILIDTRYINPVMMSRYVEFTNQDVLFLYSTLVINSSSQIK